MATKRVWVNHHTGEGRRTRILGVFPSQNASQEVAQTYRDALTSIYEKVSFVPEEHGFTYEATGRRNPQPGQETSAKGFYGWKEDWVEFP